jgi:hypothetical protein
VIVKTATFAGYVLCARHCSKPFAVLTHEIFIEAYYSYWPFLKLYQPGTVAHTPYSNYSGGRDREDHGLRQAPREKVRQDLILINKPSMVVNTCHPSYIRGRGRRIVV